MKYVFLTFSVLGMIVSSLALREHYREYGDSPCSINEHWDCGVVNHSPFAMLDGVFGPTGMGPVDSLLHRIPVAVAGIVGYIVMATLALKRFYRVLLVLTLAGFAFSLYLAHIEKDILGVWCIYCVISLGIISVMSILNLGVVVSGLVRKPTS